jgi:predicted SAM-dependent methyltransferase
MNIKDVKRVDLGAGARKKEGCFGIDLSSYEGVDLQMDLRMNKLPFSDRQLEYAYASHFLEHLTFEENLFLFNEVYRCMQEGGVFEIIVPHGFSYAGMTDLSHKTFWVEDTFGYFSPDNKYYYEWAYEYGGQRHPVINKWIVEKNDTTPPFEYTVKGWVELKLREVHAILRKTL